MVMAKQQKKAAMDYLLKTVFDQDDDSVLYKIFKHQFIVSPVDLVIMDDQTLGNLTYLDNAGNQPIPFGLLNLLKAFKAYISHLQDKGVEIIDRDWVNISPDDFDKFRIGPDYEAL